MLVDILPALFHGKVSTPEIGCWEWQMHRNPQGYGQLTVDSVRWLAHRYCYSVTVTSIPVGLVVMHKCDNPCCVRPSHLQLGTHNDNQQDKIAKGKNNDGMRNGMAKLSQENVNEIRKRVESGEKAIRLAEEYGVNRSAISKIVNRSRWK